MLSSLILGLAAAKAIIASPLLNAPIVPFSEGKFLDVTPHEDDMVVLLTDGTYRILNNSLWEQELLWRGFQLGPPTLPEGFLDFEHPGEPEEPPAGLSKRELEKRRKCSSAKSVVVDKVDHFVGPDVQMSPVTCATAGPMDLYVTKGYTVTNGVSVSSGLNPNFVKERLGASTRIDYSKSWATSVTINTRGVISPGFCGVMVTKPSITRRRGRVLRGCPGSYTKLGTFWADSHEEATLNGVDWIDGAVAMCSRPGDGPPMKRCKGDGNFH